MRLSRHLLPVLAAGALVTATVTPATAATPGVGSTTGTLTVLAVDAGDLVKVGLLTDRGDATTDPAVGTPSAAAALSALRVASTTLGIDEELPLLQVSSTGDEQRASQELTAIPANLVLGGQLLPVDLRALVGPNGAASTVGAGVADLDVLSGVLGLTSTGLSLGANSLTESADGSRSLSVDGLTVLDLGALLAGLGIPLEDLPLDTILGLVDGLGLLPQLATAIEALDLPVPLGAVTPESVAALVDQIAAVPATVTSLQGGAVCDATSPVVDTIGGLVGQPAGTVCETLAPTLDTITTTLDVQAVVDGLLGKTLDTILGILDGQTLVSLDGLDVGVTTKATDSLDTSVADVTATLGGLRVGALELGALDLMGTVEQVTAVVGQVQSTLGGVLGQIDPSLTDLVTIRLLEEATSVGQTDAGILSTATFTGLGVDLAPVDLTALVGSLAAQTSIGDQLTALGVPLDAPLPISTLNDQLSAAAGSPVSVLASGASVSVASLSQQSAFVLGGATATPTPASSPQLPTTGSNDTVWLLAAVLAVACAFGVRRFAQTSAS